MPRRNLADTARLSDIADAQLGLITARQLRDAGMSSSAIQHRIRAGGPWHRVLPGIYLVSRAALDRRRLRRAALLYSGRRAILSGQDALALQTSWAARRPVNGNVLVLVPHDSHRSSAGFVTVERTTRLPRTVERDGCPVVPVARAVVDAARRMHGRADVTALVTGAVQAGATTPQDLRAEVRAAQMRGTALVREAVRAVLDGVRSEPEAELRRLWLASDLKVPLWNPDLLTPQGEFIGRPDAYLAGVGLAVEVDSQEFHYSAIDWKATMARRGRLTGFGVVVTQVPPSRLRDRPDEFMAELKHTVASLEGRPPPRVTVRPARE